MKGSRRRYIDSTMTFFAVINIVTTGERYIKKESTSVSIEFVGGWAFSIDRCALFGIMKIFQYKNYTQGIEFRNLDSRYTICIWTFALLHYNSKIAMKWNANYFIFKTIFLLSSINLYGNGKMCTNGDLERRIASRGM